MSTESTAGQLSQTQRQKRGIWLTVIACLAFMSILWILFYQKITTSRYLSTIELRVNGLVLLQKPQLLSEIQDRTVIKGVSSDNWQLLVVHRGRCDAMCVERMTSLVMMIDQLKKTHLEKTQLVLVAIDTTELLAVVNAADQNDVIGVDKVKTIALSDAQQRNFENNIDHVTNGAVSTWPRVIIVDDTNHYRGYFTAPFDHNKMLLTYSSVIEHR